MLIWKKGKFLKKHSLYQKNTALVLLKLFSDGNGR